MENYFVINYNNIENIRDISDLYDISFAVEYCHDAYDIPEEYIDDVNLSTDGLEIYLKDIVDNSEILEEDWYIQLYRKSSGFCSSY